MRDEFIGPRRGGIVVRRKALGKTVALKYWNSLYVDTFDIMVKEMAMYCEMERRNAKSVGNAVANLVGIGMHCWVGRVLLTEAVGESMHC